MTAALNPTQTKGRTAQYSTHSRVERLSERLEGERDERLRQVILSQLAAFCQLPRVESSLSAASARDDSGA
jgi:hypothetical protein